MARSVPADLEDALAANPPARERFWAMPPEQKDSWVGWVERPRLPGARRRRVNEAVRRLAGTQAVRNTAVAEGPVVEEAPPPLPRQDWGVWLIGLVLLAGLAAFLVWYTVYRDDGKSSKPPAVVVSAKSTVPKVVGVRVQAAEFQLKEAKLAAKIVRRAATKPKGIVVAQQPKPGRAVPQGTPVTLVVSNGPPGVAMPDLVGLAAADAVRALQSRKLTATLQQVPSKEPPGTVIAQAPKAGARAKPGTKVVLQVAKGEAAVAVPDLTGRPLPLAVAELRQAGLAARTVEVPSAQPKGTVIAQNPPAGQKLAKGAAVRLNVSRGSQAQTTTATSTTAPGTTAPTTTAPTTTLPGATGNDYTGMRLSQAVTRIAQGRQQVIVQYVTSSEKAGVVVSNAPAGSRERLRVSVGPKPLPARDVLDITGEDAATAEQDLKAAGFSVISVQWPVSDQTLDGMVVYQTPASGRIPQGAAIVLYVGTVNG
jgi:beta-lactam-binding protein with PASTA domain